MCRLGRKPEYSPTEDGLVRQNKKYILKFHLPVALLQKMSVLFLRPWPSVLVRTPNAHAYVPVLSGCLLKKPTRRT